MPIHAYREPKRFNPVEDFGGDVLYVQNRCILCTRCVRFMGDVAQEPVLNVSERGDRAFIGKAGRSRPDESVGWQRHRLVPGWRLAQQGFPQQGTRLGARSGPHHLHRLQSGVQCGRRNA
ncbi:hypothetical protein [Gemmatimonas sp.]|uniref:hypothetical protein n=1 Tax=Gemmatimonas sp. TaxID=1962908 RepID=UPI003DA67504